MGELVFFAVLILFSILEAVARKRKEREAQAGEGPRSEPASRERRRASAGAAHPTTPNDSGERSDAAETMLPADLWEEIVGLASGRAAKSSPETPRPRKAGPSRSRLPGGRARPAPERARTVPPARRESVEGERSPERGNVARIEDEIRSTEVGSGRWAPSTADAHPIHRLHRDFGTDPSERDPSAQDWRSSGSGNPNAERVRAMLRGSGGVDALKRAVILREILDAPASMKDG